METIFVCPHQVNIDHAWENWNQLMIIRKPTIKDVESLEHIEVEAWDALTTPLWPNLNPAFETRLPLEQTLLAELDGCVVGYCTTGYRTSLNCNRHVHTLRSLAVLPKFRRRSIARSLIAGAEKQMLQDGCLKISLNVMSSNPVAISLYRSCGFVQEGELQREFYLDDTWVDDLIFAKHLFSPPN